MSNTAAPIQAISLAAALMLGGTLGVAQDAPAPTAESPAPAEADPAPAESPPAPVIQAEIPPELRPYEVLVSVAVARQPSLDDRFRNELLATIETRLQTWAGPMWSLTVSLDDSASPVAANSLDRAGVDQLNERYLTGEHDKVFLVSVSRSGSRYDLSAREWDRNSRTAGHSVQNSTFDRRLCADTAAQLVHRVFRPLAMVTSVDESGNNVELAIRAGEFLTAEHDAFPFRVGDYLAPYFRYLDRQREVRQLQHVPWTFLKVESVERARMVCSVVSTFRAPIAGSRRRVELMGIATRPLFEQSELRITPRDDPENPLVGYRVDVMDRLPTEDDPVEDRLQLVTDRRGAVVVPAFPESPLRHILVHSGKSVLAKVPFLPGLEPVIELSVPDDTARLNVEGALSLLEGELIDIVARQAVLMARARVAAKEQKWSEMDQHIAQLDELPDLQDVRQQIAAIQLPAVQRARLLNNRVAEARIKRMCSDLEAVAAQHLDIQKVRDFKTEMAELRAAG